MTDGEINIAIAEACGWKEASRPIGLGITEYGWLTPDGKWLYPSEGGPPDYLNDLNAMHEAEKVLGFSHQYMCVLGRICVLDKQRPAIFATARQRAEAFRRTIGKWKD